jgi:molybdenum ABC transporter molybdate-binding protein
VLAFAGVCAGLGWRDQEGRSGTGERPLIVYAAPTSRPPLEVIRAVYERETGRRVEVRYEPSEVLLEKVRLQHPTEPADLFIPADDSYVRQAQDAELVAETLPVARIRAVLLTPRGNPGNVAAWADLLKDGKRVAVANPAAAIGKLTRDHLTNTGLWAALEPHVVGTLTVTDAALMAKGGGVDGALVWDAVAKSAAYRALPALELPELAGITGRVEVAVLKQSRDPTAAKRFARYIAASDRGLEHYRATGFVVDENARRWADLIGAEQLESPHGVKP